jgi:hypothetical protein
MSGTQAATVDDIVKAAITELSQVPGQATQIYSTPRMQQYTQNAVLLEFEEMWWPQLIHYQTVGIDASTGVPTADIKGYINYVDDWTDVLAVFPEGSNTKLPVWTGFGNPYVLTSNAGRPLYINAFGGIPHRPFSVWPLGFGGNVVGMFRQRPTLPMSGTDKIYLDRLLILYDVCWMYAVDDGTIPAQVNKFQVLAANRRKRVKASYNTHPILLDPAQGMYDSAWQDDSFFVLDQDPLA